MSTDDTTTTTTVSGLKSSLPSDPPEPEQKNIVQNPKSKIKESTIPLKDNEFIPENTSQQQDLHEKETNTISTTLGFLEERDVNNQNNLNLNQINEHVPKDSTLTDTVIVEINKPAEQQKESFYEKTKKWAGNIWSKMNIKNYFPKQEYIEYKNANGIIMKIPKKKLPLKKQPNINPDTKKENEDVQKNRNKVINYASGNTIFGGYY